LVLATDEHGCTQIAFVFIRGYFRTDDSQQRRDLVHEFAPPGSLPNDGKVIDDVRKYTLP
jgi:hypothetical protein